MAVQTTSQESLQVGRELCLWFVTQRTWSITLSLIIGTREPRPMTYREPENLVHDL